MIEMTRKAYRLKYGIDPVLQPPPKVDTTPAPRVMTRAQYDAEFRPKKTLTQADIPATKGISDYMTKVDDARLAAGEKMLGATKNWSKDMMAPIDFTVGAAEAITAPIAPLFEPIGQGLEFVGDKISNLPIVQLFANTKAGEVTEKLAKLAQDVSFVTGTVGMFLEPGLGKTKARVIGETTPVEIPPPRAPAASANVAKEIYNIENNYQKLRNANDYTKDAGAGSRARIANTDVLVNAVDDNGLIRTKQPGGAVEQYRKQTIDGVEGVVRDNLARTKDVINLAQIEKKLTTAIYESGLEGADLVTALGGVQKEIAGLKLRADQFGNLPLENVHDAKISTTRNIDYNTPPETKTYRKSVARAYKEVVEENSTVQIKVGDKTHGVSEINKELGKYYGDIERLENLDGRRVKGAKLGKYTAQISGNIIGGVAGAAFGPLGMMAGPIIGGEVGGFLKGKVMEGTFGKGKGIVAEGNPLLQKAREEAGLPPVTDLRVPDTKVGVPTGIAKTKEMMSIEKQIERNIDAQKTAIKAKDFTLVVALKQIYATLVSVLKDLIDRVKATPNKEGGFAKITPDASKEATGKGESPQIKQKVLPSPNDSISSPNLSSTIGNDVANALKEAKGLSKEDIIKKHPDINLKRDLTVMDVYGDKSVIPQGEALTPYELKGNKVLLQDGETYIVSKNQFENIKGNSKSSVAKEFAPELKGTEETVKGDKTITKNDLEMRKMGDNYDVVIKGGGEGVLLRDATKAEATAYINEKPTRNIKADTKYNQYQLPEGKNYKEILIKAPTNDNPAKAMEITKKAFADYDAGRITLTERNKMLDETNKVAGNNFTSSHWSEPNVISHLRLNVRDYQGKPVTFMEELQSDWAREARKAAETEQAWLKSDTRAMLGNKPSTSNFPTHPLLKDWQELSIKRGLQEAVANGSDRFAWISGEQTSARYNLATYIENTKWSPTDKWNSVKQIDLKTKEGADMQFWIDDKGIVTRQKFAQDNVVGKKLDEVLGKGLADKIMAEEKGTLSGEGLKFGGEWANNLYDKQVKNIVEDLTGGKVEMIDMGLPIAKPVPFEKTVLSFNKNNSGIAQRMFREGEDPAKYIAEQKAKGYRVEVKDANDGPESSGQMSIKLTPEIKSIIKGEAPTLKKPSGKSPVSLSPKGSGATPPTNPLIEEAKKFGTKEEFIKAQGEPIFRGSPEEFIPSKMNTNDLDPGTSFSTSAKNASGFIGAKGTVKEYVLSKDAKVININDVPRNLGGRGGQVEGKTSIEHASRWAKKNGYDALFSANSGESEMRVFNAGVIKTKSQLTDIYNQAKGGTPKKKSK